MVMSRCALLGVVIVNDWRAPLDALNCAELGLMQPAQFDPTRVKAPRGRTDDFMRSTTDVD
jgi:hypothetical protein